MIGNKKSRGTVFTMLIVLVWAVVLVATGCSNNQQAEQSVEIDKNEQGHKKVTIIRNFKAGSLDPHNSWETLRAGVVETLVRLNDKLELEPWLATGWEAIDEVTWKFIIREQVSFHDGTLMDANAVKASLERGIAVSQPLANSLKIASIEANGQELTIVTSEPHPSLPSELVNPYSAVMSVAAEEKMGTEAFNHAPVGTGPFMIKSFTPNIEIQLERFEEYWDGKAKLHEVVVKFNEDGNVRALALQSKEADIVYSIPAETVGAIEKDEQLRVESIAGLRVHYLLYNQQQELLQDKRIRKAFDLLLDRESIAKDIMLGHATPANGPFNTSLPFGNKQAVQPLQIAAAKTLLEEAGFKEGSNGKLERNGKPLTLQFITYQGRPELPLIAQLLQSDAAKAGITLEIKTVENVDTYLRENTDWHIATYSNLSAPRGDGGYFLNAALIPGGSLNASNVSSDKLSDIIHTLNQTSDIEGRIKLTQEAVAAIREEVPHSYAVYPNLIVGVNNRVIAWQPGAEEYYIVTNKMDVK